MFGRNPSTATEPTRSVNAPADDVATADGEYTKRIMTGRPSVRTNGNSFFGDESTTADPVAVKEPVADQVETVEPQRWAHVSVIAAASLVVGTLAITATLTGLLAPLGFAAGVLALLLALISVAPVSRRHVTGHGLLLFGGAFGVVAIVLSLLAMGNDLSWLSKDTNEITVVHNWLNDHMHWLRRF